MNEVTCYKKDGRIYFRKKDIPYKRYVMKRMGVKKNTFHSAPQHAKVTY